jgi:protein-disulfide isomerase
VATYDADIFRLKPYDMSYGNKDAPVQILEYFAITCRHCEHFYVSIFPRIKELYIDTGKVFWIKRSYINDPASLSGTMLYNCADKDSKEAYLHILLTKQASWAYQKKFMDKLKNIAGLGGMSANKFDACMKDSRLEKNLKNIAAEAKKKLDIQGTPFFFINGERLDAYSYKSFTKRIDEVLSEKKVN